MLTVLTWLWGSKYGPDDVAKLAAGVRRHLKQEHRFICIEPSDKNPLLKVPGCFVRLQMFDPAWQARHGIEDRFVCLDLDVVITGPLDPLFDRPEPFVILHGANVSNPCPFNGSVIMIRAGAHPEVWSEFSLEAAGKVPFFKFPDDQGWLWYKIPDAAGWPCGVKSGIWSFAKRGWPADGQLPKDARIVVFPGWRSPDKFTALSWVEEHWRQ